MSSSRNIEFMYTSRTSPNTPKLPCHLRRAWQGPSLNTLRPAPPIAKLDYGHSDPYSRVGAPIACLAKQPFERRDPLPDRHSRCTDEPYTDSYERPLRVIGAGLGLHTARQAAAFVGEDIEERRA